MSMDKFEIVAQIGEGSFAVVVKAKYRESGMGSPLIVALVLTRQLGCNQETKKDLVSSRDAEQRDSGDSGA